MPTKSILRSPHSTLSATSAGQRVVDQQGSTDRSTRRISKRKRQISRFTRANPPPTRRRSPYHLRTKDSNPDFKSGLRRSPSPTSSNSSTKSTNILPASVINRLKSSSLAFQSKIGMSSPRTASEEDQKRAASHPPESPATPGPDMGIPAFTSGEYLRILFCLRNVPDLPSIFQDRV